MIERSLALSSELALRTPMVRWQIDKDVLNDAIDGGRCYRFNGCIDGVSVSGEFHANGAVNIADLSSVAYLVEYKGKLFRTYSIEADVVSISVPVRSVFREISWICRRAWSPSSYMQLPVSSLASFLAMPVETIIFLLKKLCTH